LTKSADCCSFISALKDAFGSQLDSTSCDRVVILQSNYIPWLGYFALIASADVLVVLDSAKYTKNDWRNRNTLRGASGSFWLTIPVDRQSTKKRIYDATISDNRWAHKHFTSIREALSGLSYSAQLVEPLAEDYLSLSDERLLHNVNLRLIGRICRLTAIPTLVVLDTQLASAELLSPTTDPTLRLVNICKELNATSYLTGARAMKYLDVHQFTKSSIAVEVVDYSRLPVYRQKYKGFEQRVSVLDYLAAVGFDQASEYLNSAALPSTMVQ
jgi:hypothetical protein